MEWWFHCDHTTLSCTYEVIATFLNEIKSKKRQPSTAAT